MGNRVSSIHGVKSPDFYAPGNGVNEIWIDNFELVSRLPFGDSDLGQAGWPSHDWPKIPWHQFIIPLKRDLGGPQNANMSLDTRLECLKPRIFQIDTAWSSWLYVIGILMIQFCCAMLCSHIFSMLLLLSEMDNFRELPRRETTYYLLKSISFVVIAAILVGIGYPMALSAASCLNPVEVFDLIMKCQGTFFLGTVLLLWIWIGYSLWINIEKRDKFGGPHGLDAEANHAQRPDVRVVYVPMAYLQCPDQSTNTTVDVDKVMESTIATSGN